MGTFIRVTHVQGTSQSVRAQLLASASFSMQELICRTALGL